MAEGLERGSGPRLVFTAPTARMPMGKQALFTSELDGKEVRQLTHDGLSRFLPHFSPDEKQLLYTKFLVGSYGDPNAVTVIASYDLASRKETQLTAGGVETEGVWSPSGKQVAYGTLAGDALWLMNADGSHARVIARPSGSPTDLRFGDYAWSSDDWIYFVVAQDVAGCFKVRIDRIRPTGAGRTRITDGGPNCTPSGLQESGDADPGISPDGKTIYSSRGLPRTVRGNPNETLRHLYVFSSAPYEPGKVETDLSARSKPDCVVGVPKVSPGGSAIAIFLSCPDDPQNQGVTLTDPQGKRYTFVIGGFGADWNPTYSSP
jgi:Tol biopolymer transport system component